MIGEPQILRPFDAAEACSLVEAAQVAGVSVETVRRWAAMHHLGRRIGGRWRVSRAALRMHLDGDKGALAALLAGDRASPSVRPYLQAVEKTKKSSSISTHSTDATNRSSA